ncbi:MAG: TatD family deoxyribonuclease [Ruminococcaceae bacterium]|nr:TatD family deoxyribonuclease [Oscillospiraceae bacterium]
MGKLFDTHAHYTDERLRGNTDLLDSLFATDISHILTVATDLADTDACIALAGRYENIYASAGIHPHESGEAGDLDAAMASLAEKLNSPKVVALGEIGLDYHYDFSDRETQMRFFCAQMELAAEKNIPVIIHDREAHGDIMNVIQEYKNKVIGIIHCCSASAEQVKEYVKMGWYISFAGVITYKNASKTLESVLATPKDRILVETDCPYLAPVPKRGKTNHSGYMHYTAEKAASLLQMDYDEFCDREVKNAKTLLDIR